MGQNSRVALVIVHFSERIGENNASTLIVDSQSNGINSIQPQRKK